MKIIFFKGATSWEFAIDKAWVQWPFCAYWKIGSRPIFGWGDYE